jgi:hypothetical protein
MVKFAIRKQKPNVTAPVVSTSDEPDARTAEGGAGFTRDAKSELFLLAVTNMVGEDTFYEASRDRDRRFVRLIRQVTAEDPAWVARFVPFLRERLHLRSASVVLAAEFARARTGAAAETEANGSTATAPAPGEGPTTRSVVAAALARPDEPAELLAYWHQTHGRRIPQPVKRGIADAARRLYTERAALKYDGQSRVYRMADVLELVHPEPVDGRQSALFRLLLDRRHERELGTIDAEALPVIAARAALEAVPLDERRAVLDAPDVGARFAAAGVTWEWLSGWLSGPMDAKAWEAVIPSMGYMALLRNLRNFDDAGIAQPTRDMIAAKLSDPAEVARSRQLPLRFFSAWKSLSTVHWAPALERGLELSLANVPAFAGRTLVLVDVSGSMASPMSNRSSAQRWELAALFGAAIAARADAVDVVAFETAAHRVEIRKGASVLRSIESFRQYVGGGTNTWPAVREHFKGHDRIVILTDEQAFYDARSGTVPAEEIDAPIYTFNLAGYQVGALPSGTARRYTFGGLNDRGFAAIDLLDRGSDIDWDRLFDEADPVSAAVPAAESAEDDDQT